MIILILLLVAILFSGCIRPTAETKTPEEHAYDIIGKELDEALENIDVKDIETELLE